MTRLSWALRASIVVATLVVIGAALLTPGASPTALSWFVAAVAVACAVGAAAMPDGHLATAAIGLLLGHWLLVVDGSLNVWTPIAAAGVVVVHVAASMEAITPTGSKLTPETYRLWVWRTLAIIAFAVALWLVAVAADHVDHTAGVLLVVLFGLLAGAGIWVLRWRVLND